MIDWIDKRFSKGFYFPFLVGVLRVLEKLSLGFWIKRYVKNRGYTDTSGEKAPPWVSELYQFVFVVLGCIAIIFIDALASNYIIKNLGIFIFAYRIGDILIFTLNWIFVHDVRVHMYRRSIAGFFLNLGELAIYVLIISTLANCTTIYIGKYELIYQHLSGILSFSLPKFKTCFGCQILSAAELFLSVLLILVVIAGLVGGILREEVSKNKKRSGLNNLIL
jgi:hypothetical protein